MQSYLLLNKKSKFTGYLFVTYVRWLFGPIMALIFPDTVGLKLPFEKQFFYIEHYLAAFFGPLALLLSGRYGFFEGESWRTLA
jgi:uncharacterized membrane protein YwaF